MGSACSGDRKEQPVRAKGTPVSTAEVEATAKRRAIADAAVRSLLKRSFPNETITLPEGTTPVIGLAVSGGGWRSMTASVAFFDALSEAGVLDAATYVCGVSGGGWCVFNWMLSTADHNPFHGKGIPNPWYAGNRFDPSVHRYDGLIRMRDETWVRNSSDMKSPLGRIIWGIQDGILSSSFNIISDIEMVIPTVLSNEKLGPNKVSRWGSFLRDDVLFWHDLKHDVGVPTSGPVADGTMPIFANAMIADLPKVSEPVWAEASPFGFRRLAPHPIESVPTDKLHVSYPDVKEPAVPAKMHHMLAASGAAFALDPDGLLEQTVPDLVHRFDKTFGLQIPSTAVVVPGSQTRVTSADGNVDFGLIRDAGILNNIPWPLLLNHMGSRHIDVLVVLDNSALKDPRPLNLARAIEQGWYEEGVLEGSPDQLRQMTIGPEQHHCMTFHPKRKELPIIVYCMGSNTESTFEVFVSKTDLQHSILDVRDRARVGFVPAIAGAVREVAHTLMDAKSSKLPPPGASLVPRKPLRSTPQNEIDFRVQLNSDLQSGAKSATAVNDSMKAWVDKSATTAANAEQSTVDAIHDKLATFARQFHGDQIAGVLGINCGGKLAAETGERFAHPFMASWYAVAGKDGYVSDGLQSLTKDLSQFYSNPDLELVPIVAALHAIKDGKSSKERDEIAERLLSGIIDYAILKSLATETRGAVVNLASSAAFSFEAAAMSVAELAKQVDVVAGSTARQGIRHQLKLDATMVALAEMAHAKIIDVKEIAAQVFAGERLTKLAAVPPPTLLAIAESAAAFELPDVSNRAIACISDEAMREGYRKYISEWGPGTTASAEEVLARGTPDAIRRLTRSVQRPDANALLSALEARLSNRDEAGFAALMNLSSAVLSNQQITKLAADAFQAKLFWPSLANHLSSLPFVPTSPAGLDFVRRCTNVASVVVDGAEAVSPSPDFFNALAAVIRNSDVRRLEIKDATAPLKQFTAALTTLPKHVSLNRIVVSGTTPVDAEQVFELLKTLGTFHKSLPATEADASFTVEVPVAAVPDALPPGWSATKASAVAKITLL